VLPEVGDGFSIEGYTHTSTKPETVRPEESDRWLVEASLPMGSYLTRGDHRGDGGVDGTHEVILARGSTFRVTEVDDETRTIRVEVVSPEAPGRSVDRARSLLIPTTAGAGSLPVALPDVGGPTSLSGLSPGYVERIMAKMDEVGTTVPDMTARIVALIDEARTVAPSVIAEGMHWYETAQAVGLSAAAGYGLSPEQGIGIVAALSPRLAWESNAPWTGLVARLTTEDPQIDLTADERERAAVEMPVGLTALSAMTPEQAAWAMLTIARREGMRVPVPTRQAELSMGGIPLPKELAKAIRIARGEPVDDVLSGHKVRSFYNNMVEQGGTSVTIDTHAISAALGVAIPSGAPAMKILETPSSVPDNAKGIYSAVADAYRIAGERLGISTEQAQAIAWLMWREVTDGELRDDYCIPHLGKTGTISDLRDARRTLDGPGLSALVAAGSWRMLPPVRTVSPPEGKMGRWHR
jgi:hypothetical protein